MSSPSTIPTPATPDVCTSSILIDGTEIPGTYQVLSITISREVNRIPSAILHIMDGEASKSTFSASNAALFIPGKKIELQFGYRAVNTTVFKGMIIKQSVKIRKSGSSLVVECRDEAVKMTCGRQSRYFADQEDSDIMETVIGSHGLSKDVEPTTLKLKEIVQYDSTDWDFLVCRAEANGRLVIAEDGKIRVVKPVLSGQPAVTVQYGATILELDAEMDARWQSGGITASSWSAADQKLVTADAKEPAPPQSGNISPADLAKTLGTEPRHFSHGGKVGQSELQAWADARLLTERLGKIRGRVRFQGMADVMPGKLIAVNGIGERFEGVAFISGVRHSLSSGNWETDVQFGLSPALFAESHKLQAPPAGGLLPGVHGLQIGIVTQLEKDPEGEDRIKVRVPLISAAAEGIWARVVTLDAGKNRGTFFRPEIGDEVVVGFLGDDPRHPLVLGMCHSSAKPAPEQAADTNHRKGYVSREKMKFTFDDEKKSITLETPGGNSIMISDDGKGIALKDQNGNVIQLDNNGITIKSAKNLVVKAAKDISMDGMNVDVKAGAAYTAKGTGSAEVSGASTTIKGSASTVIQGGIVQIN